LKLLKITTGVTIAMIAGTVFAADPTTTGNTDQAGSQQNASETAAQSTEAAPAAAANTGSVSRATFTSGIENREPTDKLTSINTSQGEILYFTELRDMAGQSVIHRWEHGGKIFAEVPFKVGGNRWRVYSSKKLDPSWTGPWKASVIGANGETLSVSTFNYEAAPEKAQAAPAEAAPAAPEPNGSQPATK